jgi:hypothetical protein
MNDQPDSSDVKQPNEERPAGLPRTLYLRDLRINRKQAAELRARLATFAEDWSAPGWMCTTLINGEPFYAT